ncbi:MAG: NAD(P)/FAD-dependent oxidoreductase [Candidatus Caldarchaeum sp.]|nr:NAD(P)/FAD-dependent oxidoreductase [Candidatus Caldarchaeum sp.]
MKIAVVGLGVAGTYLIRRLSEEHEVVGFDRQRRENFKAICAWGTSRNHIKQFLAKVDVDFDEYVLHIGENLILDNGRESSTIPIKGLCTYDKARLQLDMTKGYKVFYGVTPTVSDLEKEFDLIVDATGVSRSLLPPAEKDEIVPCFEYHVRYNGRMPYEDFYVRVFPNTSGYLWYFPLGEGEVYVGAGHVAGRHVQEVQNFLVSKGGEPIKRFGKSVRLAPPENLQPFTAGKVVGVGESIGTVFPMLGEGIIPSLECAEIFAQNLHDLNKYREEVLKTFKPFSDMYRLVKLRQKNELSFTRHLPLILRCYRYMKSREERFGLTIRKDDLMLILNA